VQLANKAIDRHAAAIRTTMGLSGDISTVNKVMAELIPKGLVKLD
jgi:hypothetical protein